MLKKICIRSVISLVLLVTPILVLAQSGLRGEVIDYANGAVVVGAKISVSGDSKKFEARSNAEGKYELVLVPGQYNVVVEVQGFKTIKRNRVTIEGKGLFTFNVNLDWDGIITDSKHP